jgi:hypothetical protein
MEGQQTGDNVSLTTYLVLFEFKSITVDITATLCSNKTAVLLLVMWCLDLML